MNNKTKNITVSAIFAALVFVITRFIQIPIPFGYFNAGNSLILLSCLAVPSPYGIFIGSLASALADLTSYPAYTIPTLVIKAVMPYLFYLMISKKQSFLVYIIAAAVSTLIPLFGYTLTGGIIYGNIISGLAQFPGLALEYLCNLVIFAILIKSPILKIIHD